MAKPNRIISLSLAINVAVGAGALAAPVGTAPAEAPRVSVGTSGDLAVASLDQPERATDATRCTEDHAYCIRLSSYVPDVCGAIESLAARNGLDPNFFVRLIWQESLFDAGAVSPVGAQGIAQFMPGTARMRGLDDPFNPAEALSASAAYLAELSRSYGNIGLAAVAYNGGEARADRFMARDGQLPDETSAYVQAITGKSAETWRDAPPEELDLSLVKDSPFRAACIEQGSSRTLKSFRAAPRPLPAWGVIVASNRDRDGAERQVGRLKNRYASVLGGETVSFSYSRGPGLPGKLFMAQIGRGSRADADALCSKLKAKGGDCMVLKN